MGIRLAAARLDRVPRANLLVTASALAVASGTCLVMLGGRFWPGDTLNYLAAGERLNAGHQLYELHPELGDRAVPLIPPYWSVPLVSPPLVGVAWRPLALLGEASVYLWWLATLASLAAIVALMTRVPGARGPLALYLLAVPLGVEAAQGNLNAFLQLGTFGIWWLWWRGKLEAAAVLVAVMAVAKLTPAALAVWLLLVGGRRALLGLALGGGAAMLVGIAGAGIDAHIDYLDVIRQTATMGTTDYSLGGIARALGVPVGLAGLVPIAVVAAGLGAMIVVRRSAVVAYRVAVILLVAGSPVVYANTPVFLFAILAPAIWPLPAHGGASVPPAIGPATSGGEA